MNVNCILLIDDNMYDNLYHTITIEKINAAKRIKTATTGDEAIEYLEKAKQDDPEYPFPDLIFLDINMPGMNGFDFLQKAIEKGLISDNNPPLIVMLTSSLNPSDENLAKTKFSREIKEYCNKPLDEELLLKIIEHYFASKK